MTLAQKIIRARFEWMRANRPVPTKVEVGASLVRRGEPLVGGLFCGMEIVWTERPDVQIVG